MGRMRFRVALGDIRSATSPVIVRRAAIVAGSGLAQRFLAPAMARVLFEPGLVAKLCVGLALSVVFTVHTLIQRSFAARTEADLLQRTAEAVLDGNVLRARLSSDDEVRAEINQAIYMTAQALSQTLPNLAGDAISCATLGAWIAMTEPPRLVMMAAALTLIAAAALFVSRGSVEKAVARAWQVQAQAYGAFVDILDGRLEVVASGQRRGFLSHLRDHASAWGRAGAAVAAASALAGRLPLLAIAVLVAIAVATSASVRNSVGVTLADVAVLASVTPAFAAVAQGVHLFAKGERWVGVVARVLRSAQPARAGARAPGDVASGGFAFDQVTFRYEDRDELALRGVTFACAPASTLALAGPNGSGKSTCLRLLLALARPTAGRIVVAGETLDDIEPDAWRRRVAFLPQRPYLPPRSQVRQAVRWLASGASDERILQALDRVGILASLRRGGRDPLTVTGDTLSIGERQRVALARLLCHDADLFVLDEPDANLDPAGIALVANLLRDLAREHVVVVAAHTPELLAVADRILTLQDGQIVRESSPLEEIERLAARRAGAVPRS